MARKVTVALEDDLDGGSADETVRFGFEGAEHEIDLSAEYASTIREQLGPFILHAASRAEDRLAGRPDCGQPSAQRRDPRLGEGPRPRGQRARADPATVLAQYQAAARQR